MIKYVAFGLGIGVTYLLLTSVNYKKIPQNGLEIARYLVGIGYSKAHAAGIAGNIFVESRYNPKAIGDNGKSFGLAQWHKSRWDSLKNWSAQRGVNVNSVKTQLDFLTWELNNNEKRAKSELIKTNNPNDSAYAFAKYYERPSFISELRMEKANEIYKQLQ